MINKSLIFLLGFLFFLLAGCQKKEQKTINKISHNDSLQILQTVLEYTPLDSLVKEFKNDRLYIISSLTFQNKSKLFWNKKLVFTVKNPKTIPFSNYSQNFKFYCTIPMMKLNNDTVKTTMVFNELGDTGLFYLTMNNGTWHIIKHEFGKI